MLAEYLQKLKKTLRTQLNSNDSRAKIQDADFIAGLLYASASSTSTFSLATLRLSMCNFLGNTIGQSAFNERMGTLSLRKHVQVVLESLMSDCLINSQSIEATHLTQSLRVNAIIGIDGSLVSLWDGLAEHFQGTFMTAAIKLHFAANLLTGEAHWLELTEGRTHDSSRFPDLEAEQLYVFDLGYWSSDLFEKIASNEAYFLSRIKSNAAFKINSIVSGRVPKNSIGSKLNQFPANKCFGEIIEVSLAVNNRSLRGVGFWNKDERRYHWYLTNLDAKASALAPLYRLRWQMELSFKSMKSVFNLDRIPTLSPNTTQTLCLLAVCNYMIAMKLRHLKAMDSCFNQGQYHQTSERKALEPRLSLQRAATMLKTVARDIFHILMSKYRVTSGKLHTVNESVLLLIRTYCDPNSKSRMTTQKIVLSAIT